MKINNPKLHSELVLFTALELGPAAALRKPAAAAAAAAAPALRPAAAPASAVHRAMPPDLQPLAQRRPRHVLRVQNYPMIIRPQPRRNCCVRCRLGLRSPARPPGRPRAAAARGRDVAEAHAQQQLKPETAAPPAACQYARVPSLTESGPQAQGPAPVRSHRGQLPPKSRSPPAARRLPVPIIPRGVTAPRTAPPANQ